MAGDNDYIPLATSPADAEGYDEQKERILRRSRKKLPFPLSLLPASIRSRQRLLFIILPIPVIALVLLISRHFFSSFSSNNNIDDYQDDKIAQNPYFWTGDVWKHNEEIFERIQRCSNLGLLRNTSLPLKKLSFQEEEELIKQGCGTNQTTIMILSSLWFAEAFAGTSTAGETIYAQSVISTLNALNYSYIFSSLGWYNADMRKTVEYWLKFKNQVRLVLADPDQVKVCYELKDQKCLKTKDNLDGIEAWRLLTFWYWDDPANPLGEKFTLSPSPRNDNWFLSYSIEPTCHRLPFIEHQQRLLNPQAYLLAKQIHYLEDKPEFSWTLESFIDLQNKYNIKIIGGMTDDEAAVSSRINELGVPKNLGKLNKIQFYDELSKSFVFIGVGRPRISPSPWDALCMGVPFINPILKWDEEDPENRTKWHAQQWHMTDLEPPFVYSVKAHDLNGLSEAVGKALNNPIKSYIPDYMKFDFAISRTAELIETDWKKKGEVILQNRIDNGQGQLFEL